MERKIEFTIGLHLALEDRRLNPAVETALYRVLQEAIVNIVRHADATVVGVLLEANDTEVRLIIEDDGRGFSFDPEPSDSPSKRLGLLGQRRLLARQGGVFGRCVKMVRRGANGVNMVRRSWSGMVELCLKRGG
jgi:two-component system, chemotaxis family, sensor kinase Cph1